MTGSWTSLLAAHEAVRDPARQLVPEHEPVAAVLACSDARVPPSVIFDQPAGSLFVVRVAGNTASPAAIASFDFAVAELGVELLIVLGHTSCGAVAAACAGECAGYLEPLTATISGLIEHGQCDDPEVLAERNVRAAIAALASSASPTGDAIRSGAVAVQGAIYDLATDDVRPLSRSLPSTNPTDESKEAVPS